MHTFQFVPLRRASEFQRPGFWDPGPLRQERWPRPAAPDGAGRHRSG